MGHFYHGKNDHRPLQKWPTSDVLGSGVTHGVPRNEDLAPLEVVREPLQILLHLAVSLHLLDEDGREDPEDGGENLCP